MTQPAQAVPASMVAILPPPKPVPTAAERAVLEGQRQQRIAAEVARNKVAAQEAAVKRQAEIDASWRQVHAEIRDPFHCGEAEDLTGNHGWGTIHAEIRASRPHYGEQS